MTGPQRREKRSPKYPWIIPTVVSVAVGIIVAGLIVALALGVRLF